MKYRSLNTKGFLFVRFSSNFSTSKGYFENPKDKTEIDLFCIYCPDTDKCYYFKPEQFKRSVNIRINEALNKQIKNVHLAEHYLDIPK